LLTFEPNEPPARRAAFDWTAIPLAALVTFLPFFGVSWLTRGNYTDPGFLVPVIIGLLVGVLLLVSQYRKANPLVPVRPISNTLPVTGILLAMLVGATFTTLLELSETFLLEVNRYSAIKTGALLAPLILGVIVSSVLFYRLVATKWTPLLALS